ncbi:MAG: DnaB-like helicase N-terminal domain-containing protein, partial [Synergistaceae bacterium]
MNIDELQSKQSEAGVISSLLFNPSLIYHSDELIPSHFSNKENGWIYWAIKELVNDGVNGIDVFNLSNMLNSDKGKKEKISEIPLEKLKEIFTYAEDVARTDENDYKVLVKEVLGMALKRATYKKLKDCERMCFTEDTEELQGKIYSSIDKIMMDFNCINEVPEYKDIVRPIWERIKEEQKG